MRYCDPHNDKEFASFEALKAWMPVNIYNGGNEHTTRHLLYARFWNKFFYDIGLSPVNEPFETRISQGLILGSNNLKMSKSLGNVVDPREVASEYGADSLRLWECFIGDYFDTVAWNDNGVKACHKLLSRVWAMQEMLIESEKVSESLTYSINFAINKVSSDIENTKFNTAVAAIMTLTNDIYKVGKLSHGDYKSLLLILNPFAPHITEEIWERQGYSPKLNNTHWPRADEKALIRNKINLPVQINGKMRGLIEIDADATQSEILENIKMDTVVSKYLSAQIKKVIYIPGKIINIIVDN